MPTARGPNLLSRALIPQRAPQLEGTSLGLRGAPTARGLSVHMHNDRRDRTIDADDCWARGPNHVYPKPQAIVATTSNPRSSSMDGGVVGLVFSKSVIQLVSAMKAVHLEPKTSTSLGAPIAPFEAIELRDALKEDAPS